MYPPVSGILCGICTTTVINMFAWIWDENVTFALGEEGLVAGDGMEELC